MHHLYSPPSHPILGGETWQSLRAVPIQRLSREHALFPQLSLLQSLKLLPAQVQRTGHMKTALPLTAL